MSTIENHPFHEGKPVAFVYQEPGHPISYQVRQDGVDDVDLCGTSDLRHLRGLCKHVRAEIVFLTQAQIEEMFLEEDARRCRPMTTEEQEALLSEVEA